MLVGNPPLELQAVPAVKNPFASAGGTRYAGLIPGWGRFPGEGHGQPLQCSCLENPMDRGARRATVPGVTKSRTRLSEHTQSHSTENKTLGMTKMNVTVDFLPHRASDNEWNLCNPCPEEF